MNHAVLGIWGHAPTGIFYNFDVKMQLAALFEDDCSIRVTDCSFRVS